MKSNNQKNFALIQEAYYGNVAHNIMPAFYVIEPTNLCNYSCPMCPNKFYKKDEKGILKRDLFVRVIAQIREYADVIQLYWVGEPLLADDIFWMIKYCKKNTTAKIMISTNGSLLSREKAEALVKSGLDKLIVSMDAAESDSIYKQMRTNGNIDTLNSNVNHLLSLTSQLDITLQFILTKVNEFEKEKFIKQWQDKGVKLSIQCLYTWADQMPELKNFSNLLSPMIGEKRVPCADLWYKMVMHWNGDVAVCCFDWSFENTIGNVNSESVQEIWNGAKIKALRKLHYQGQTDLLKLCKNCDAWATEFEYENLFD